jgi:hypothetical protein
VLPEWRGLRLVCGGAARSGAPIRQAEIDAGSFAGVSSEESVELKRPTGENAALQRANAIFRTASALFAADMNRPHHYAGNVNPRLPVAVSGRYLSPMLTTGRSGSLSSAGAAALRYRLSVPKTAGCSRRTAISARWSPRSASAIVAQNRVRNLLGELLAPRLKGGTVAY